MKASFRTRPCELRNAVYAPVRRMLRFGSLATSMFWVIRPWRKVVLSIPVMEISPRFVSRLYPAVGGKGAFWLCSVRCAVVENSLRRTRQRLQTEGLGRIMVELV